VTEGCLQCGTELVRTVGIRPRRRAAGRLIAVAQVLRSVHRLTPTDCI